MAWYRRLQVDSLRNIAQTSVLIPLLHLLLYIWAGQAHLVAPSGTEYVFNFDLGCAVPTGDPVGGNQWVTGDPTDSPIETYAQWLTQTSSCQALTSSSGNPLTDVDADISCYKVSVTDVYTLLTKRLDCGTENHQ